MNTRLFPAVLLLIGTLLPAALNAQQRTLGVLVNDTSRSYRGYTLFAPKHNTATYLIDNDGRIVHQWTAGRYEPGQSVYLLPNGHLLRSCMTRGALSTGGGEGGRIEEYDWDGALVWQLDFSNDSVMQHHDIRPLPNGNILLLAVERKSYQEVIDAGFDPARLQPEVRSKGMMLPDCVFEIEPTRPAGGRIVWEWHVWDHLVQDLSPGLANYGVPSAHPELINCDGDGRNLPIFWNHMNSVDYNPELDQIALSVRGNSEVWIIDHSTTSTEAKGHAGGRQGRGGDLLYRWGNPAAYGLGTPADETLYEQHDAEWIRPGCPGAGHITVFNNGVGRAWSSVDEFVPPVDSSGAYAREPGRAFGPEAAEWIYTATPKSALFATAISGAQRLPNGNTLIDDGTHGRFIEVTHGGDVVWTYVCPVVNTGPLTQGDTIPDDPVRQGEKMNAVFRVTRYALDYDAFAGRTLLPGSTVERQPAVGVRLMDEGARVSTRLDLW